MKINNCKEQANTIKLFLFVPLLLIILYVCIPFILMIFYSFTNWDGYSKTFDFVGLINYKKIFTADNIEPFINSMYYLLSSVFQFIIGLFLAHFVYFQTKFKKLTIVFILLPVLINTVAIGLIFKLFFQPGSSFDMILSNLHIVPYTDDINSIKWIGNIEIVNYTLAFIAMWRYTPYTFILFYGAFEAIDKKIVKAAMQQGASRIQITYNILLPNIKMTMLIIGITLLIGAISTVELPMIMTNGTLGTKTIVMRIHEIGFSMRNFGLASALSIFVSVIIFSLLIIKNRFGGYNEK